MTGDQVREARRLLGWSAFRLEAACNLPNGVIYRFERTGRLKPPSHESDHGRAELIRSALEAEGVEFTIEFGKAGVRLQRPEGVGFDDY